MEKYDFEGAFSTKSSIMTKNELLELSAKLLGIDIFRSSETYLFYDKYDKYVIWNPLNNNNQAMQLMADYRPSLMVGINKYIDVEVFYRNNEGFLEFKNYEVWYQDYPSVEAAIRYAIVLGAAEAYKLRMEYSNANTL